ncbi:MAG: nickel-dependent lactate racemase [candidate division WOR-3 bacterium]
MDLKIACDNRTEQVSVPEKNLLGVLQPNRFETSFCDINSAISKAAQEAKNFIADSHRILVLLNDYTRPTPNEPILKLLEEELNKRDTKYLICLGTHRQAKEEELKNIIGEEILERIKGRIIQHDCRDRPSLYFLGKTRFGTEVELNRALIWAERIITINSIEPHYFAGYTGGRKCFIPGIAGIKTIAQNHNLLLHPASAPFSLKENPVHLDMTEAARMVPKPVFSIQLVQDSKHNLLSVHCGDLFTSFEKACLDAYKVFAVPLKEKADIILSVLQTPYTINFYQSQRAVEFAIPALKPNGIQITVSPCYDGVGNDDFVRVLQSCSTPDELLNMKPPEVLGWHKAARLARIMQKAQLYTVMPGVKDELIRSVFMHPFSSIQAALDFALEKLGKNATIYIIPDAGSLVPVVT